MRVHGTAEAGTAAISPEGDSMVYTARPDAVGQDSFIYQVRDLDGDTATSTVTIGISGNKASPAPVTFSDYLQMTVGADNAVSVYPTSNDIDPTGGVLTVLDVVPNAPAGSDEYSAGLSALQAWTVRQGRSSSLPVPSGTRPRSYTRCETKKVTRQQDS